MKMGIQFPLFYPITNNFFFKKEGFPKLFVEYIIMICNPKSTQNSNVAARCIVPSEKLGNNMARAQFIAPLQHNKMGCVPN